MYAWVKKNIPIVAIQKQQRKNAHFILLFTFVVSACVGFVDFGIRFVIFGIGVQTRQSECGDTLFSFVSIREISFFFVVHVHLSKKYLVIKHRT